MHIEKYLQNISKHFKSGKATEHTYRGDLQTLIEDLVPDVLVTNEPKKIACGAPDYIISKRDIPIGYIEAKDIGDNDLEGMKKTGNKEQFDRYRSSLGNLIFTDYLDFHLYVDGENKIRVKIADIRNGKIVSKPESFDQLINLIQEFCHYKGQTITSSQMLAKFMAKKARMLDGIIESALQLDIKNREKSSLWDQMEAFKKVLIHDIEPKAFADIYAQTIAYGMFAARFHDKTLETFSRQEAAELIPKSNPFLRSLFGYIAGPEIDDRIKWVVDSLAEIFRSADVASLLKDFGRSTQTQDPIIHFYETFLAEYDPALRKAKGVYYTPRPVVNFITRSIDEILKSEFEISDGIADHSMIDVQIKEPGEKKAVKKKLHKVQFLDPATGTGTFLAELISLVKHKFDGQEGIWSNYVENHLIPRMHGFEILMASYAMAHLKIEMLLHQTGFKPSKNQRLKVFLTNSLEEYHEDDGTLFALARWLSEEARHANDVKRDAPVMIVFGNPPYSGESSNKGEWIMSLMEDYKKEPGGVEKLKERNPKWINDDYVKFIRYGQHFIEKNEFGILAFINPHGFLDNPTFRGMRWNLLKTYDKIYTIDLHGNSKKKEKSPDGSLDENVFDIQQGVSINFFIKTGKKKPKELAKVFHFDLFGKRDEKYNFLSINTLNKIQFLEIEKNKPNYFFVPKEYSAQLEYDKGFSIHEIFSINSAGIVTARDEFTIHFTIQDLKQTIEEFIELDDDAGRSKFNLGKDVRDWSVSGAKNDLKNSGLDFSNIVKITYRPFEYRYTYYSGITKGFHCMPRAEVMKHLFKKDNISLICPKQVPEKEQAGAFVSKFIAGHKTFSAYNINYVFPLYIYPDFKNPELIGAGKRKPNLNMDIVLEIANNLGLTFSDEKESTKDSFAPMDLFDYIYAILHSQVYRKTYKEYFKSDFPRIPYPSDKKVFWELVNLGGELRELHLLESLKLEKFVTKYPKAGSNLIDDLTYSEGYVYINSEQFFTGISDFIWNFSIGGYQPAQKWLNDRKGMELTFEDISYYQKIIVALFETDRIMKKIDNIEFLV
ncbi:type ISP restriction/modification enzyme [Leptospira jelokensis]|uniref:site-specific DNA-methyltransferase (adenine-specific) n=1 Tax=Leptospira jelokensis TaxID=2484931 RepID=A0A4Z0ZNH1_9LEPT|nr:type ISP restriction/modification enzyme [Leptospira jelokensis]TGL58566.1 DNA methyltransferase [Leptospira jelokensis]